NSDKTVDENFKLTSIGGISGSVKSMHLNEGILYVGGNFNNFPGQNQSHLIAYNTITNEFVQNFNANFNFNIYQTINSILVKENELLVGGTFNENQPAAFLGRF